MDTSVLTGIGAAPGSAEGTVVLVIGGVGLDAVGPDSVVVADVVGPAMAPALKTAAALVVDTGGQTSHAAIFAREAGIPAVVGVAGASHTLTHGTKVRVDGDAGTVTPLQA